MNLWKASLLAGFLFAGMVQAQQPPGYRKISKKELRELKSRYEQLDYEYKEIQKNREQLETTLKAYDAQMKLFTQHLGEVEQQMDNAGGTSPSDPKFLLSTRQVQAAHMSYNLQSIQLLANINNEQLQLSSSETAMHDKYTGLSKIKNSGR
jgi:septal ring factor EnvC (AmiA/AmiB activator)